jgi:hypothetical protein
MRILAAAALLIVVIHSAIAQSDPFITAPHRNAVVYAGPGDTFLQTGFLRAGVEVRIVERNRIGNWLHIQRGTAPNYEYDGWVMRGYIKLDPALRYSEVPVNEQIADGDPSTVGSASQKILIQVPIIPDINPLMEIVYQLGQEKGNRPNVVTKVGDSVIQNPYYLRPFSQPDVQLGAYDYLKPAVDFFGPSLAESSIAAQQGMSSYVIFDPLWANPSLCLPNETPLACEYRVKQPAVAFISFGPNDVLSMTDKEFAEQMRKVVQESLNAGVIPVLTTFSTDPAYQYYPQSMNFNLRLVEVAQEFAVPIINLWLAARPLPAYGLDVDSIHYLQTGFTNIKFDSGLESWYGVGLQNLLAIRTLYELYTTLNMGQSAG